MAIVLDCSVASAWALSDERTPWTSAALKSVTAGGAVVPSLFWFELRNILVVNERRGRISQSQTSRFLRDVEPMVEYDQSPADDVVLDLARTHGLSVYDASYLELSARIRQPLCTLDGLLITAAPKIGVEIWQP